MAYSVSRTVVDAFYQAYAARDAAKVAPFLHPNIEWIVSGPMDVLPFCGTFRGKAAVVELIGHRVPSVVKVFGFVAESILVDGDQLAMLHRQSGRRGLDGRVVSYRVANFMRFEDDKVITNLSLIDSFDAVEQVLGRPLSVHESPALDAGNVVAL
jgi:ketosteroid isomerase-like protein